MAGSVDGTVFWLPSEFLTDDDFLRDKENFDNITNDNLESEFCFPVEFPYGLRSEDDERLEKFWVMSASPQPTKTHLGSWTGLPSNGSPNGVLPSPATFLVGKYDAVEDLIYRAAGQVAKLKLNSGDGLGQGPIKYKDLLGPPRSHNQFYPEAQSISSSVFPSAHQKLRNEGCRLWYSQPKVHQDRGGRAVGEMGQAAWAVRQNQARGRAVLLGRSCGGGSGFGAAAAAKRACAGTGVFLPRRYGSGGNSNAHSSDSRNKSGSSARFPGGSAAPAQAKKFDYMNGFARSQPQRPSQLNLGMAPDYNSLAAERHAIALQRQQRLLTNLTEGPPMMGNDVCLPREWTY